MAVFRCKMCGANLNVTPGMEICECESCGTNQTLPKFNDDRRVTMYERANHFRRNSEFDKAMNMYEQILNEDKTDAEAYWSIVLCRYGIEYVEDPATHKRVPTVNRAQHTSIFADEDYKEAINYATLSQRVIFEEEAKAIDDIQKGILEISRKEEPFDVFICYKESDENGNRTKDSVLANDIYHQLTREGFKVFFAAITLEDKLGQAYEPYIFAALNSAKVMIVLGTKPEYFVAPWVKNEWSRYLKIIKNDPKKVLIPAYRDMDAYDLPEEFSFLQAQDMAKIGFMNDLIHGIKKIAKPETGAKSPSAASQVVNPELLQKINSSSGVDQSLKRAFFFIEDGDWNSATLYFEKALDMQPECAMAYVGKLMVEYGVKKKEDLAQLKRPFTKSDNYARAIKFADDSLKKELEEYNQKVLDGILGELKEEYKNATTEKEFEVIKNKAEVIRWHTGVEEFISQCSESMDIAHKEMIYSSAKKVLADAQTIEAYIKARKMFEEIGDYKDASELLASCIEKLDYLEKHDTKCAICREKEGRNTFIPGDYETKCCDKCMTCIRTLYQNRGRENATTAAVLEYFREKSPHFIKQSVRDKIDSVVNAYLDSVPRLRKNEIYTEITSAPAREKTEYEIEEEKKAREQEIQRRNEARRKAIEKAKADVIEKNAAYEYDIQVVIDKTVGGTDSDMLRYVLSKSASNGWKLHSMLKDKVGDGAPVGQTILVFERRIKKEE